MARKARVYRAHNLDGTNQGLVYCANLATAAILFGASVYDLRRMGWCLVDGPSAQPALCNPGVALYRPITPRAGEPWRMQRWHRRRGGVFE